MFFISSCDQAPCAYLFSIAETRNSEMYVERTLPHQRVKSYKPAIRRLMKLFEENLAYLHGGQFATGPKARAGPMPGSRIVPALGAPLRASESLTDEHRALIFFLAACAIDVCARREHLGKERSLNIHRPIFCDSFPTLALKPSFPPDRL